MTDFPPTKIGSVKFANGTEFTLTQINEKGAVLVTSKGVEASRYATTPQAAWKTVMYMGGVEFSKDMTRNGRTVPDFHNGKYQ